MPHGIAVALSGPSVFAFTAPSSPDRHREAAAIFNTYKPDEVQDDRVSDADIGNLLHDRIARFLVGLGLPRGLSAIGYKNEKCAGQDTDDADSCSIPELVKGTLPQRRVLDLAPGMKARPRRSRVH